MNKSIDKTVERTNCILAEEEFLKKAVEARNRFIELSIIEDRYCPECGSRVYLDENDRIRCMKERLFCNVAEFLHGGSLYSF